MPSNSIFGTEKLETNNIKRPNVVKTKLFKILFLSSLPEDNFQFRAVS